MKTKINFMFASLFAFILLLGGVSATLTVPTINDLAQESGSFDLTISSDLNETVELSISDIVSGTDTIAFTLSDSSIILDDSNNRSVDLTVDYVVSSGFDFEIGEEYSTELILNASNSTDVARNIAFEETNYCGNIANEGKLEINDMSFDVKEGFGDEDDYWYLMDNIEVEMEIANDGRWDIKDVELEWELYTTDGRKVMHGDLSDFDLDEDDEDVMTVTFELDEDLKYFEDNDAIFYVKVTGEIDDSDSAYDGDDSCAFESQEVEVVTRDDFVILDSFRVNDMEVIDEILEPTINCGANVNLRTTLYNIGEDDMDDVYVQIYNKELGIFEKVELGDIDAFKDEDISYNFELGKDIEEKMYRLEFEVYDEDNDVFENKEDDLAEFSVYFTVEGNCKVDLTPSVSAVLDSEEVVEGEEVLVKVTIVNDDANAVFSLNAEGYESWAELIDITPQIGMIDVGQSKEFIFKFNLKDDTVGNQEFNVLVSNDGEVISTQGVALTVEEGRFNLSKEVSKIFEKYDLTTILIVVLNIILLIAIIIVARKVIKRK